MSPPEANGPQLRVTEMKAQRIQKNDAESAQRNEIGHEETQTAEKGRKSMQGMKM